MIRRWLLLLFVFLVLVGWLPAAAAAPSASPRVDVLEVKGAIVPVVKGYIQRGVSQAEREGAQAVIILLNTPGGLVSTTQEIIETLLGSRVPVIVYVYPPGAWAGSAGAFITLAGHIAAMAPGTFIGAAHPIAMSPSGGTSDLPPTQEEKVVNALASAIRSVAQERGRNVDEAEDMVRRSVARTDREAVELNLVDLQAASVEELMAKIDGRQVKVGQRTVTLQTRDAPLKRVPMSGIEGFLLVIANPNIAYILLALAMLGIFVELTNPGLIFPGIVGGISLFLALYSLGTLEAYWAALLLVALGFLLFLAEVFVTSHGLLAVGGIASLTVGSLLLFSGSAVFRINPGIIAGVVLGLGGFLAFALTAVIRTHRRQPTWGKEGMIGQRARVRTRLAPVGTVSLFGELWEAVLDEGSAEVGEEVVVSSVEGLRLRVSRIKISGGER